jgi:hypothetical protein
MASSLVAPPVVKPKALFCPNCGGPVELRGFGYALTVVCPQCLTVLDASTPLFKVLQQIQEAQRRTPLIPLGTRGKLAAAEWEVIGFQTRGVEDEGTLYEWEEYLLFNPYKGFRYLTNYEGHWNWVIPLEAMPLRFARAGKPAVRFDGRTFKHFTGAMAQTTFVLGEFPWRVKVGDVVQADDFVDAPTVLSSESTDDEVTWSRGEYTGGAEIWKAFGLPGSAPRARGVYLNQPSPFAGKVGGIWSTMFLMLALLVGLAIAFAAVSPKQVVFEQSYTFAPLPGVEPSFVTNDFDLKDRTATLELAINTDLADNWAYFNFALINADTGDALDFGREVSFYRDSDGNEGSPSSAVLIPSVAPGRYYLRVEPEMETGRRSQMRYHLTLRHGVPAYGWFWIAGLLLLIPPIFYTMRARSFETRRWSESDYPAVSS